ncbi:MAG: ABC transporter ATP-binding protein [Kiritimatiellae bacterium]|nr:ABC transporter ATP-binding protein [Kiritimatiellia bacterium]
MNALAAKNLIYAYRNSSAKVLDGLTLEIAEGSFEALMGPSGCGKSTFLHIAAGLLSPQEGKMEIAGEDVGAMNDSAAAKFRRRNIGFVQQDGNLVETLSVSENAVLPATLAGERPVWTRFYTLAAKLGLWGLEEKYPAELSGGERQRAAIARALYAEPAIILADEPTGSLDLANARKIRAILQELNKTEKSAILLVTHDPQMAAAADRVHFLKDGRIASSHPTGHDAAEVSRLYLETYK